MANTGPENEGPNVWPEIVGQGLGPEFEGPDWIGISMGIFYYMHRMPVLYVTDSCCTTDDTTDTISRTFLIMKSVPKITIKLICETIRKQLVT